MTAALCRGCGILLAPFLREQGVEYHPDCELRAEEKAASRLGATQPAEDEGAALGPEPFAFSEPQQPPSRASGPLEADHLLSDLIEVVQWASDTAQRSQQVALGPSELGHECDRYLAYRIAGWPTINHSRDPWPAIVGTAIHAWLEGAITRFQAEASAVRWITEREVHVDLYTPAHVDVYDTWLKTVIDWKSMNPRKMKVFHEVGASDRHLDQTNLYGLAYKKCGHEVDYVAIAAVPRSGWLSDMELKMYPYDESRALRALARRDRIAQECLRLEVDKNPHMFEQFDHVPDPGTCRFCPFWRPYNGDGTGANGSGCPARSSKK